MTTRYKVRRDSEADWLAQDPVLAEGEIGHVTDTNEVVIGDGASAFSTLTRFVDAESGASLYLYRSGLYYGTRAVNGSDTAHTQDELILTPFFVGKSTAFDRIGVEVTGGAASSNIRLGIYEDGGDGYPSDLLVDAGAPGADTIGFKDVVIDQTLSGLYWIGAVNQGGAPTTRDVTGAQNDGFMPAPVGQEGSANIQRVGFVQTGVSGALPATFTATEAGRNTAPYVLLRAA